MKPQGTNRKRVGIMKITIRKLAELAGVSRGTVDKVVHGRPGVSDPVREKVLALLEEYQYAPRHKAPEPANPEAQKVIAVLMPRLTNPFFANLRRGMEDTCAQMQNRRVRMEYFDCDEANIPEMLNILSYLEERGVDGIAMRGVQSSRIRDKLNAFAAARVPVLLFDSDVIGAERLCIVGEDSRRTGRLAASLLAKSIGGAGEVAIVGGSPDVAVHRFRIQGFQELVREKYPQMRIIEVVNSFDQSVITYEKTVKMIERHPDLRGIFSVVGCPGDIGQALIDCKATRIKMVSYNFTPDVVALIKRGIIEFTIGLSPYRQGELAVQLLADYVLFGKKPAAPFVETPVYIGVDENIDLLSRNGMV